MKKNLLSLFLLLISVLSYAQHGLDSIIVEKYYISDATDAANSSGTLPVGSVTYRIYVDMAPGYKFQAAYGVPNHAMKITTTTSFFNNTDYGTTTPTFSSNNSKKNTVMLDSWLSVGGTCAGYMGILKSEDNGVGNFVNSNNPKLLQNTNPLAGIPLTTQDGMIASANVPVFSSIGIDNDILVFNDGSTDGNSFITNNGAWSCLVGAVGPTATNRILIAQITTDGDFHFELNIQIGTPTGGTEKYVASNPYSNNGEYFCAGLTYPQIHIASVSVNPTSKSITVSATQQLTATVLPANATNKYVSFASDNASVATVNSTTGLVTAVAAGTANITVTTNDGAKTATTVITVTPASVSVASVSVDPTSKSIAVGATQQLTATVLPANATNKNVSFASDNTSVATVNSTTGLVTAVAAGTANITATTEDGGKVATCVITIVITSIKDVTNNEIELFPNPVSSRLYLKNLPENSTIMVYDMLGKKMFSIENNSSVDVSNLKNGVYFLEVNKVKSIYKFIKR